jgi:hypothetical protein
MLRACLEILAHGSARDLRSLAAALGVSETALAGLLEDLASRGYLEAVSPAHDPRALRCSDCPTPGLCGPAGQRAWILTDAGRRAAGSGPSRGDQEGR